MFQCILNDNDTLFFATVYSGSGITLQFFPNQLSSDSGSLPFSDWY